MPVTAAACRAAAAAPLAPAQRRRALMEAAPAPLALVRLRSCLARSPAPAQRWRPSCSAARSSPATSPSLRSRCVLDNSFAAGGGRCSGATTAQALRPASCRRFTSWSPPTSPPTAPTLATSSRRGALGSYSRRRSPSAAFRRCRRSSLPLPSHAPLQFVPTLQGFNEFLTSKSAQAKNKNRQFRLEDRVFSLSSITSPGVRCAAETCNLCSCLGSTCCGSAHCQALPGRKVARSCSLCLL